MQFSYILRRGPEEIDWQKDENTIEVNVLGFSATAHVALTYFFEQGIGHLVGTSSVSAPRGESSTPAYSASKAFVSNYFEGIRYRMAQEKREIYITDIQPDWVETDMAKGEKSCSGNLFCDKQKTFSCLHHFKMAILRMVCKTRFKLNKIIEI